MKQYITKREYKRRHAEVFTQPSQTVKGETYSMRELIARYQQGLLPQDQRVIYFDEEDLQSINHLFNPGAIDLTDLDELNTKIEDLKVIVQEAADKKRAIENEKKEYETAQKDEITEQSKEDLDG